MGEVYQARDTKLDRDVALKVLPDAFTADPDRLARFEREAKVLASLNHPNIGLIYGLEEAEGTKALVLELVEGPTLADRIAEGPIPIDEALPIAKQIAEALEAAHERGIIHRDLKPANVKVKADGTVKVLDFGLAKAFQPDAGSDPSDSPTVTAATQQGVILETAVYMSPEAASGKPVDKRSDIWSFGVVLFEMLSSRRVFDGESVSHVLAEVLKTEPDWTSLPAETPAAIRTLLRRCLAKARKQRLPDIGAARLDLDDVMTGTSPDATASLTVQAGSWRPALPLGLAALAIGGLISGVAVWNVTPRPEPPDLLRFTIAPEDTALEPGAAPRRFLEVLGGLAISSDGGHVVYTATALGGTEPQLMLRSLDQRVSVPIQGSLGGSGPVLSPDGEWVAFVPVSSTNILQRVRATGGSPETVTESPSGIFGASWGADGQIIFGALTGLYRVPAVGGEAEELTKPDIEQDESFRLWPEIIPDRQAVVFVVSTGTTLATGELAVLELDTRIVTKLGVAGTRPHYLATGHLVFATRTGALQAVPFDAEALVVTGAPVPVVEGVAVGYGGSADFSVSNAGHLVYVPGGPEGIQRSLVWVDRLGEEELVTPSLRAYTLPRLSPDGTRVALDIRAEQMDTWILTLATGAFQRLTSDIAGGEPVWMPDGERAVFKETGEPGTGFSVALADGTGTAERQATKRDVLLYEATPDGTMLVAGTDFTDIVMVSVEDGAVAPLISSPSAELSPALSPDGNWIAYQSDESGQFEIHVQPFPAVEQGQYVVSTAGGVSPAWAKSGEELYYVESGRMMAVAVQTDPAFVYGDPEPLFQTDNYSLATWTSSYDVASDGRFLMIKVGGQDAGIPRRGIDVILNWVEELKQRVPVP